MTDRFPRMATLVPETDVRGVRVEHFTIGEREASWSRMRAAATRGREQPVSEGRYAKLLIDGALVMSDTDMERDDHDDAYRMARGDVLIAGLGLGMYVAGVSRKSMVNAVTVVEKDDRVVEAVAPHVAAPNVTIVRGDARVWTPPPRTRYDTIWLDIWDTWNTDVYEDMRALKRRYRRFLRRGGWIGVWKEEDAKYGY